MGKTGYIIQEIGYEYNDEYYYRGEAGGGTPKAIITDEAKAKDRLIDLEMKSWRSQYIGSYGYDLRDITRDEDEFLKIIEEVVGDSDDWYDVRIDDRFSDDQLKRLIRASTLRFHEIVPVEIEEPIDENEHNPSEEMLNIQDGLAGRNITISDVRDSKISITGNSVLNVSDEFVTGNVKPMEIPEEVSINDIKEVVKETEEDFLTIKQQMKELRDEARKKLKNFFIKGMDKVFEMYPEVKTVSWTQYTPYFNDGEECTFSAHVDDFYVNGWDDYGSTMWRASEDEIGEKVLIKEEMQYDWIREPGESRSRRVYKTPESRSVKIYEAISGFLSQLDDDDYKTMFGDHARITVKKGEVEIEEYDHD